MSLSCWFYLLHLYSAKAVLPPVFPVIIGVHSFIYYIKCELVSNVHDYSICTVWVRAKRFSCYLLSDSHTKESISHAQMQSSLFLEVCLLHKLLYFLK